MQNLKSNIDHYMELKGIRMYSHLLVDIALELGIKGQEAYKFANREKSNFSKMLKGERPLKYEFIIPLEKIFGISLARLLYEDAYKLPVEKENVPFKKGFRIPLIRIREAQPTNGQKPLLANVRMESSLYWLRRNKVLWVILAA